MPFPPPPRAPGPVRSSPRRRSLLASAAGAALLMGCSTGSSDSGNPGDGPSAAERARARAAQDSQELARRYDAVLAAHPALAERLRPLRAQVAAHAEAFGGMAKPSPGASAATTAPEGSGAPAGAEASRSPAAPADQKDALASLAAAERSLSDRRTAALLRAPGELARLLASVAAAGAAHAYLLTEGDK
ncbi:hypothetical protein ACFYNZ_32815 [Streptomyces kebangsaanensis]|uniref:Lipoprotein n=1 Tax=Streptomyces kebangsaanensis TaxID=864058 RepID=A0ABW6L240_9ACTN